MEGGSWVEALRLDELPTDGTGISVQVGRLAIALFRTEDGVHAIGDTCPHAGASLGAGVCLGHEVTCPAHGMHFSLVDGTCTDGLPERVVPHPVRVHEGWVLVKTPGGT